MGPRTQLYLPPDTGLCQVARQLT